MTSQQLFLGWVDQNFGAGASALPPPGDSTLGGVKRNAGGSGQYVTGIGSDGSLQFGVPAGVSGSTIIRAQATLQGYTTSSSPATAPAQLQIQITGGGPEYELTVVYNEVGSSVFSQVFSVNYTSPGDGSIFIDLNVSTDPSYIADQIYTVLEGLITGALSVERDSSTVTLTSIATGSNTSLTAAITSGDSGGSVSINGGGTGSDEIPGGGQISYAKIVGAVSGMIVRPLSIFAVVNGLGQPVYITDNYDDNMLVPAMADTGGALAAQLPDVTTIVKWMGACLSDIYVYFNSATTGGTATIYLIAEILAVPAGGTFLFYTCIGTDYCAIYADGAGSTYSVVIEANSSSCDFGD